MWHKPCRTFHPWCLCIKTRCLSLMWFIHHPHLIALFHTCVCTTCNPAFHNWYRTYGLHCNNQHYKILREPSEIPWCDAIYPCMACSRCRQWDGSHGDENHRSLDQYPSHNPLARGHNQHNQGNHTWYWSFCNDKCFKYKAGHNKMYEAWVPWIPIYITSLPVQRIHCRLNISVLLA